MFFATWVGLTCEKNSDVCFEFSFDERQCQTDEFLSGATTPQEKFARAEKFLSQKGITTREGRFDPQYLTIVCEACHVCPTGLRFFFNVPLEDTVKISRLEVLNPELAACL